jgi:hypothetical protein
LRRRWHWSCSSTHGLVTKSRCCKFFAIEIPSRWSEVSRWGCQRHRGRLMPLETSLKRTLQRRFDDRDFVSRRDLVLMRRGLAPTGRKGPPAVALELRSASADGGVVAVSGPSRDPRHGRDLPAEETLLAVRRTTPNGRTLPEVIGHWPDRGSGVASRDDIFSTPDRPCRVDGAVPFFEVQARRA